MIVGLAIGSGKSREKRFLEQKKIRKKKNLKRSIFKIIKTIYYLLRNRWQQLNKFKSTIMKVFKGSIPAVITPFTEEEGESYEFYLKYPEIIDSIADLSRN